MANKLHSPLYINNVALSDIDGALNVEDVKIGSKATIPFIDKLNKVECVELYPTSSSDVQNDVLYLDPRVNYYIGRFTTQELGINEVIKIQRDMPEDFNTRFSPQGEYAGIVARVDNNTHQITLYDVVPELIREGVMVSFYLDDEETEIRNTRITEIISRSDGQWVIKCMEYPSPIISSLIPEDAEMYINPFENAKLETFAIGTFQGVVHSENPRYGDDIKGYITEVAICPDGGYYYREGTLTSNLRREYKYGATWKEWKKISPSIINSGDGINSIQQSDSSKDVDFDNPYYTPSYTYAVGAFGEDAVELNGNSMARGELSIALGRNTLAEGDEAFSAGTKTAAVGSNSVAFGVQTLASGSNGAFAEGDNTRATGNASHAENYNTLARGDYSHAGGRQSYASAEGVFVHGMGLRSAMPYQTFFGQYNSYDDNNIVFGIGGGSSDESRLNAFEVTQDGVARAYGTPVDGNDLIPKSYGDSHYKLYRHYIQISQIAEGSILDTQEVSFNLYSSSPNALTFAQLLEQTSNTTFVSGILGDGTESYSIYSIMSKSGGLRVYYDANNYIYFKHTTQPIDNKFTFTDRQRVEV